MLLPPFKARFVLHTEVFSRYIACSNNNLYDNILHLCLIRIFVFLMFVCLLTAMLIKRLFVSWLIATLKKLKWTVIRFQK